MDALIGRFSRLVLPLLCGLLFAPAASAAPALWRVSDADSAIWLFGSIHILDAQANWRTPAFNQILTDADEVYFELLLDEEGMATLGRLAIERGFLPAGTKLTDLLTDDENKRLAKALADVGMIPMMVDPMQPWMAGLTLSTASLTASGAAGDATFAGGIESQLQAEISDERERGLETPEEQLDLLSQGTEEEQIAALMKAVDELDEANAAFGGLIEAWLKGDVETIHEEIVESVGSTESPEYQALIAERNERWAETLSDLLAGNTQALIVVGAAHLAGPDGVPALLDKRGFEVERIDAGQ